MKFIHLPEQYPIAKAILNQHSQLYLEVGKGCYKVPQGENRKMLEL